MCGRYTLTRQDGLVDDLEAALDPAVSASEWWKPRWNVAPTQPAPVVTLRDGARVLELMRWGLVPFWAGKPGARPPLMINARVESIDAKAVFRDALERKRCLVPADGFFEWKRAGKQSTPIYLHPEPRHFVAFAGLWARAKLATGELRSFTIITGPANPLVAPIHDRMPVVLDRSAWAAWLDPSLDRDGARALLGVPPVGDWRAERVSTWVNAAAHDDARCIAPDPQGTLV
ncbi:MAG TPA: SOS response-associated peptidase [Kofleriaceae bacterium]|nr:SOS response-associated peptidase [Kofleriaceae bacterium]